MLISIVLPDLRGGGVERVRIGLAFEFARKGHDVAFVLMQARGELLDEVKRNFSVVDLACPRVRSLPLALALYLRRRRPDALLAAMWPLSVVAPLANVLSGSPAKVLVSEHNALSVQYQNWGGAHRLSLRASMRALYPLAHARIGVSRGVVEDIAQLSRLPESQFGVIRNPVALKGPSSDQCIKRAEEVWGSSTGPRVLSVGSFKHQKNHALLIRAFARLEMPGARLMILGEGALRPSLEELAGELGISEGVSFPGFQSDPTPFYHTADLFVLSSNHEGLPNVMLEALACGTPVVSTDCPCGPAEILENGRWGRLTPVGDAVALAAAMRAALEEDHDTEALKRRAADFSPEIAARRYLEALDLA